MDPIGERSFYYLKGFTENRTIRLDNPDFQTARFAGPLLMNFIFQVTPAKDGDRGIDTLDGSGKPLSYLIQQSNNIVFAVT